MNPVKGGLIDNDGSKVAIFPPKPGMENHDGKGSIGHQAAIDSAEHEMKDASAYPTKNNIPEKVRVQIAGLLQGHLVNSIDLTLQAKQAHWNVKGPNFIALHELFDKVTEEAEGFADLIAERIVQLGGIAIGTLGPVDLKSTLPTYPLKISGGKEHVAALSHSLASYGESIRAAIAQTAELNDAGTADILTEISRAADKNLWFVEAHAQAND
jgi:starvation-inducible DNA-binding protein